MNETLRDSEALDRYIDALMHDPNAHPSDDIDPKTGDLVQLLVATETAAHVPHAALQTRVWQTVLNNSSSQPRSIPHPIFWNRWLVSLAAAIILLLVGIWVLSANTRPVSAAAILAQAKRVAADPKASGLQSVRGVLTGERRRYNQITKAISQPTKWKAYIWFQAPDRSRAEYYIDCFCVIRPDRTPTPGPFTTLSTADPDLVFSYSLGSEGATEWYFDAESKKAGLLTINPGDIGITQFNQANDLQSLLQDVAQDVQSVKLIGDNTVLGRPVYILDVINHIKGGQVDPFTHERLTIDQQTYLVLGEETLDDQGKTFYKWDFASLELNPAIDPAIFKFNPPTGVKVTDMRTVDDEAELLRAWQLASIEVNYPLYQATELPNGFRMTRAKHDDTEVDQYILSKNNVLAVYIEETVSSSLLSKEQKITVGAFTGYYREGDGQYHLRVDTGTTQVALTGWSSEISKDDFMKLAASLQKVE